MVKIIFCLFLLLLVACGSGSGNGNGNGSGNGNGNGSGNGNGEYSDVTPENAGGPAVNGDVEPPDYYEVPGVPRYNEYHVTLDIDPVERVVSGISRITFTNRTAVEMETIVLRVYLNAFSEGAYPPPFFPEMEWRVFPHGHEYAYMDIQYASVDGETLDFSLDGTVLTLVLPEPLEPNATAQILLQYSAGIPGIAHRTGGNRFAMWFGMFLPVLSVFDGEEWHTGAHYPAGHPFFLETANYIVEITTPLRYTVVGTGLRTEEAIGETKITRFTAQQVRDFTFAVSPYYMHASTETESGITIHLYYYTETLLSDEILYAARQSMEHFEAKIGIFPFGHVTIVEANMLQDSASFSQVVFVSTRYFEREGSDWGLTHGLGNQWFANIVGTNRIAEPWLTEGLTRFVQITLFYPTPEALRERMERDFASIAHRTTLYLSRGLYASPNHMHYAHAHGRKAMLMVYSLHQLMGEEAFWQFIAEYFQTFSFEIATVDDFIGLAEGFHGESLSAFFDEWLNMGTVPGLP